MSNCESFWTGVVVYDVLTPTTFSYPSVFLLGVSFGLHYPDVGYTPVVVSRSISFWSHGCRQVM